ncbi:hypothetical protein [Thermofilum sp.]|uniref:hypothetical protein n=1 Tax=Thermofilum sp. TaxID=1961369 RepID=UPI0031605851
MRKRSISSVFYLKPRQVKAVVYLPTLLGVRPFSLIINKKEVDRIISKSRKRKKWLAGGKTEAVSLSLSSDALSLLLLEIPDICKKADFKKLDEYVKTSYRHNTKVKEEVYKRALGKVLGDKEIADAYLGAWLKANNFELPPDDPDASKVSSQFYKLVWKFGDRYVLQDPPWC